MKTVIYHSADYDGIFCREIAKKFLGETDTQYIGWNFGDEPIKLPINGEFIVMDLPIDKPFGIKFSNGFIDWPDGKGQPIEQISWGKFTWIDHHKSAMQDHPEIIPGYRIDGVAACRLAWQWFAGNHHGEGERYGLPPKLDFINRTTDRIGRPEPLAVRLAGEYDIWDKRDPRAETFQYALRVADPTAQTWERLLRNEGASENAVNELLTAGAAAQKYQQKIDADLVTYRSYRLNWEGLNWIVLNTGRFNSLTFSALDKPETGHDALLGYMFNGKVWTVSLYHAKHNTGLDLSQIAIKHGGGGHRGACGFTCEGLPPFLKS